MAATPNKPAGEPMAARAEALGERVGRSLARARRRFERRRPAEQEQANTPERPAEHGQGNASERPPGDGPLVHRADDLVKRFERGFASYAAVLRSRVRRGAARIREEAEDIAAEAAHLRESRAAGESQPDQSQHREAEPAA